MANAQHPLTDTDGMRDRTLATERQIELLVAFYDLKLENDGQPPTLVELSERLGMSSFSGPQFGMEALVKKGYLTNSQKKARGYRLTDKGLAAAQAATRNGRAK